MTDRRVKATLTLLACALAIAVTGCGTTEGIRPGDIVSASADAGKSFVLTGTYDSFLEIRKSAEADDLAETVTEMEIAERAFSIPNPSLLKVLELDSSKAACRVRVQDGSLRTGWIASRFLKRLPQT